MPIIIPNTTIIILLPIIIPITTLLPLCSDQADFVSKHWKDVCVGDFIRLSCDDTIPADLLLLWSSDTDDICYIQTSNLDGETNLKQRQVPVGMLEKDQPSETEQVCLYMYMYLNWPKVTLYEGVTFDCKDTLTLLLPIQ